MRPSRSAATATGRLFSSPETVVANDRACEPFGWNTNTFFSSRSVTAMRPDGPTATPDGSANPEPGGDSA